jgi:MFS family permease
MTIVSAALVENPNWGRRPLLLYGNIGITISLAGLTALYTAAGTGEPNQAAIIACILAFVGCYQVGFGPITWLVLSEIFPLRVRSAAVSMGTLANFGSNLLVALLFEWERQNLGEGILFGQFALIALAATLFTAKYVFETRGLSLEEIETKLKAIVDGDIVAGGGGVGDGDDKL